MRTVLIADESPLLREGLSAALTLAGMSGVAKARRGAARRAGGDCS